MSQSSSSDDSNFTDDSETEVEFNIFDQLALMANGGAIGGSNENGSMNQDDFDDEDEDDEHPEFMLQSTPFGDKYGCFGCRQGFSANEVRVGAYFPTYDSDDDELEPSPTEVSWQHINCLTSNQISGPNGILMTHGFVKGPSGGKPPFCKMPGFEELTDLQQADVASAIEAKALESDDGAQYNSGEEENEEEDDEEDEEEESDDEELDEVASSTSSTKIFHSSSRPYNPPNLLSSPSVLEQLSSISPPARRSSSLSRPRSTSPPSVVSTPHANLSILTEPSSVIKDGQTLFDPLFEPNKPKRTNMEATIGHVAMGFLLSVVLVGVWVWSEGQGGLEGEETGFILVE
ncbi:hypothetical protein TrVE_jg2160 [Triparma verrucosa]|uniref:PARP-type domain-containing protein n=2 Tax=Triparma TaxID=722752 RepID=A0A9W7EBE5_9STRA|nr:hypothetical protein TrST_g4304 [Triparma strigata]GMH82901.1 hypothetical protein TrVE_jg2160 [Triparma verrucosa]